MAMKKERKKTADQQIHVTKKIHKSTQQMMDSPLLSQPLLGVLQVYKSLGHISLGQFGISKMKPNYLSVCLAILSLVATSSACCCSWGTQCK